MIHSFRDKDTEALFNGQRVRRFEAVKAQAERRLQILDSATSLADLAGLPSNRVDHLSINQIELRCLRWFLGTPWLPCAWEGLQGMVDFHQSRQITAESVTEKARHAQDHGRRHLDELQGRHGQTSSITT